MMKLNLVACFVLIVAMLSCEKKEETEPTTAATSEANQRNENKLSAKKAKKPRSTGFLERAKKAKAQAVCSSLAIAIDNFESEYNFLPYQKDRKVPESDQAIVTDDSLMSVLTGDEEDLNFKQIRFFAWSSAKGSKKKGFRDGIHEEGGKITLYDPWGRPYRVIIDYDLDGQITNPFDATKKVSGRKALIYSLGKDGKMGSDADNQDNVSNFE